MEGGKITHVSSWAGLPRETRWRGRRLLSRSPEQIPFPSPFSLSLLRRGIIRHRGHDLQACPEWRAIFSLGDLAMLVYTEWALVILNSWWQRSHVPCSALTAGYGRTLVRLQKCYKVTLSASLYSGGNGSILFSAPSSSSSSCYVWLLEAEGGWWENMPPRTGY